MITLLIVFCILIGVAIICNTYYRVEELRQCFISENTDDAETLETILRLINKYSKLINDNALNNNTNFVKIDSILTFFELIRGVINNKDIEDYDED